MCNVLSIFGSSCHVLRLPWQVSLCFICLLPLLPSHYDVNAKLLYFFYYSIFSTTNHDENPTSMWKLTGKFKQTEVEKKALYSNMHIDQSHLP